MDSQGLVVGIDFGRSIVVEHILEQLEAVVRSIVVEHILEQLVGLLDIDEVLHKVVY